MNADELKSKIAFTRWDTRGNMAMLAGKLEFHAVIEYDRLEISSRVDCDQAMSDMKEKIREMILQSIYDDQRDELEGAIDDLLRVNPMDYIAIGAARERILKASKRQRPLKP